MTRFLNISTDNTLGGLSPSDEFVASQKAIKEYVDNNSSNVQIDDLTITQNANDDIQAVGTINKNTASGAQNPVYDWVGTYQEWVDQDVAAAHPEWVCFITDDSTSGELKANTNLDNLTEDGKNIANWSSNVSNCITNIPQDIKLELFYDNGQQKLKIKAGSKFTIPNGTGVFDTYTLQSDYIWGSTETRTWCLCWNIDDNLVFANYNANNQSGTTVPSGLYGFFYHTDTNYLYDYRNSVQNKQCSFPFAVVKSDSSGIVNIENIFNGFGYIGSTIFMLPGVKCLAANGKNADGSLNNILRTISGVQTMSLQSYMAGRQTASLTINSNGILSGQNIDNRYWGTVSFLSDLANVALYYSCYYCIEDNKIHYRGGDTVEQISTLTFVGSFDVDVNNKITKLKIKQVYCPVDYNDREFIASQAMPSKKYIDLTLGTSGTTYIAEASGYVDLTMNMNASGNVGLSNISKHLSSWIQNSYTGYLDLFMPVEKGDSFQIYYTNLSNVRNFRLVILNGSK